jgi:hypothetical protein
LAFDVHSGVVKKSLSPGLRRGDESDIAWSFLLSSEH